MTEQAVQEGTGQTRLLSCHKLMLKTIQKSYYSKYTRCFSLSILHRLLFSKLSDTPSNISFDLLLISVSSLLFPLCCKMTSAPATCLLSIYTLLRRFYLSLSTDLFVSLYQSLQSYLTTAASSLCVLLCVNSAQYKNLPSRRDVEALMTDPNSEISCFFFIKLKLLCLYDVYWYTDQAINAVKRSMF